MGFISRLGIKIPQQAAFPWLFPAVRVSVRRYKMSTKKDTPFRKCPEIVIKRINSIYERLLLFGFKERPPSCSPTSKTLLSDFCLANYSISVIICQQYFLNTAKVSKNFMKPFCRQLARFFLFAERKSRQLAVHPLGYDLSVPHL